MVGTLQNTTITLLCAAKGKSNGHKLPIHLIVRITAVALHIVAAAIDAMII
ncbi:MAG TPA: hypothetical protein VF893_02425 [Candidatus Bathyarchaeia archaeon]